MILDTLQTNDDFKYLWLMLKQSLLDDYMKWMPQDKELKKLVKAKKTNNRSLVYTKVIN